MDDSVKKVATKKSAARTARTQSSDKRSPIVFSNPFFVQEITISSTPAQNVFTDGFERCDSALRSLSVVLPVVLKNESEIMSVNGAIEHILNGAFRELREEQARVVKIAEDNGIEIGKLGYTNVVSLPAKISCGKAGQFLQMIREFDKLIETIHATWLVGFIPDDAKAELERKWRKKVMGVVFEIETINKRAFEAAQRNKVAPMVDDGDSKSPDGAEPVKDKPKKKGKAVASSVETIPPQPVPVELMAAAA